MLIFSVSSPTAVQQPALLWFGARPLPVPSLGAIPLSASLLFLFGAAAFKCCMFSAPTNDTGALHLPESVLMSAGHVLLPIIFSASCGAPYRSSLPSDLSGDGDHRRAVGAAWLLPCPLLRGSATSCAIYVVADLQICLDELEFSRQSVDKSARLDGARHTYSCYSYLHRHLFDSSTGPVYVFSPHLNCAQLVQLGGCDLYALPLLLALSFTYLTTDGVRLHHSLTIEGPLL